MTDLVTKARQRHFNLVYGGWRRMIRDIAPEGAKPAALIAPKPYGPIQRTEGEPMNKIRRDAVKPGMIVKSSHGYKILVTRVDDTAPLRVDDRHVGIFGHLHGNVENNIVSERYPASSLIEVESRVAVAPTGITIPRDVAIDAEAGCIQYAMKLRRDAKKRSNGGPALASHRAWLRQMADSQDHAARAIRAAIDSYDRD